MKNKLQDLFHQGMKYPVLMIAAGALTLFCLVAFFIQLGTLFSVAGWFAGMLLWYVGNLQYLFADIGTVFGNVVFLFSCFFYTIQFVGTGALLVFLFGMATGALKQSKTNMIVLLASAVAASFIISPVHELFSGLPVFSSFSAFLYRSINLLPMNLAALVTVAFLLYYYKKKKAVSFTLYLLIAGGIQVLLALMNIIGSSIFGSITFGTVLTWVLNLLTPVVFVFLGCLIETKLTGKPVPYVGKIISLVNNVKISLPVKAAVTLQPAGDASAVQPEEKGPSVL